jgi:arylsulfatase A
MDRRTFIKTSAAGITSLAAGNALAMSAFRGTKLAPKRPNVVVIFTDDQGYQDLGCYGSPDIKTPNIDTLAADGMKFTDFYVASPVCSASRAALLTGCYPDRVGVPGVFFPNMGHKGLSPKYVTIAEMLKTIGYKTKAVGKWHLGDEEEFLPTNQGFDSYYGIPYSNDMWAAKNMKYAENCIYREGVTQEKLTEAFAEGAKTEGWKKGQAIGMKDMVPLMRDEECIEFPVDQSTITKRFTNEGIKFISESVKKQKPFFLYLAHSMPHVPLYASAEFKDKSQRGRYGDVIEEIDYNVGRITEHLKKLDIEKNTIVVFTSDNGPWLIMGEEGGSALPLFEGKMTTFEGGQRVPAIMKWPGKIPAGAICKEIATTMDIMPTLAHITGAELLTGQSIDGKNIFDLITAKEGAVSPHEFFFYAYYNAVRWGNWKYHRKEIFKVKETERDAEGPTLYNLKKDIGESKNVIDQHPEIAKRLKKAIDRHWKYIEGK